MVNARLLLAAVVTGILVAGCSGAPKAETEQLNEAGEPCTALRGVVVDEAIRPLSGALVEIATAAWSNTTDEGGAFTLPCLADGSYFIKASHPLYNEVQQAFGVGGGGPHGLKLQLQRVIFATPYAVTQKFDGFLVCSIGFSVYASEECGEGAGVPCEVPVLGCQRVGGQGNNYAQYDFYLDGGFVRDLVIDMTWDSSSPTLESFYLVLATEWTCDPFCIGNELNITTGADPLYLTQRFVNGTATANTGEIAVDADTRFSTFVWPDWGHGEPARADVAINQPFNVYATAFYYLPAPEGWSFLGDSA